MFSLVTLYSIVFDLYILGRDDSDSGGSSAAAIAQGVTGGIIGVFVSHYHHCDRLLMRTKVLITINC